MERCNFFLKKKEQCPDILLSQWSLLSVPALLLPACLFCRFSFFAIQPKRARRRERGKKAKKNKRHNQSAVRSKKGAAKKEEHETKGIIAGAPAGLHIPPTENQDGLGKTSCLAYIAHTFAQTAITTRAQTIFFREEKRRENTTKRENTNRTHTRTHGD